MLTYETILAEAKRKDMPMGKMRGIIREYLQTLTLKQLYRSKWQDKFFFLGGTSLRLLYGSKRFSEDLDFNVKDINKKEFESAVKFAYNELKREGISCTLKFNHKQPLFISEFIFGENILKSYGIVDKRGEIIIKLEVNAPEYKLTTESCVVNSFGELFLVNSMSKSSIFADKIDTLRNKKRGRHVYDIIFMLSKNFPVDRTLLKINGVKEEPKQAILNLINEIPDNQLEKLSKDVAPFLFDEAESKLIRNAKYVVKNLLEGYNG